jgi:ATP-dependent DNA helicase RecQ
VAMGHLRADSEAFGALKLTETARGVLKGETEILLREQTSGRDRPARAKSRRGDLAPASVNPGQATDANLLGVLRAWRSEVARTRGVPAYVVLHDATIEGIAAARPRTPEALRDIPGIGDKKLERYGRELIELVNGTAS